MNDVVYFGMGSSDRMPLRDMWQYNATNAVWRQLPDFPGGLPSQFLPSSFNGDNVNSKLINFVFDNRIVLISGSDWNAPESWTFDTSTEQWFQNEPGSFADDNVERLYCVRSGAVSIVFDGDGYV